MDRTAGAPRPLSRRRALRRFGLGVAAAGAALAGCASPLARGATPTAVPIQRQAGELAVWAASAGEAPAGQAAMRLTGLPGPQRAFFSTPAWQATVKQNFAFASWPDLAASAGPFPARAYDALNAATSPLLLDAYAGKTSIPAALEEAARRGDAALRGQG